MNAGARLRIGEAGPLDWDKGGGTQLDMMGQRDIGDFFNERELK